MNIAGELIIALIVFLFGCAVAVGRMWMNNLKDQIKELKTEGDSREVAADGRMKTQEGKTEECQKDRDKIRDEYGSLKFEVQSVQRTLKIVKKCPEPKCPNIAVMQITGPIGYVREQ